MHSIILIHPGAELPAGFPVAVQEIPDVSTLLGRLHEWSGSALTATLAYHVPRVILTVLDAITFAADEPFIASLPPMRRLVGTGDLPDAAWAQAASAFPTVSVSELMETRATPEGAARLAHTPGAKPPAAPPSFDAELAKQAKRQPTIGSRDGEDEDDA